MNPNWIRWIAASIAKYWTDYCKQNGINLYLEAQDRQTGGSLDFAEVRWNGPIARETTRGSWELTIDMNSFISSILSRDDQYAHKKLVGKMQAGFVDAIPVYKYGDTPEVDDQSFIDCLQARSADREALTTTYFGRIDTNVELEQSTIEQRYFIYLKGH
jgi:hypothetical protein